MRKGIYVSLALLAGALLAQLLLVDPGYVVVAIRGYVVEMSLPAFVLLLAATLLALRLLVGLVRARARIGAALAERRRQKARRSLTEGLLELAAGNWRAAEDTLTRFALQGEAPVAHYLAAARAAELQGEHERRDNWLARASESAPDARAPVLITQAEFQIKHKQLEAALSTLEQLEASGEQNPRGLLLLARVYRQTGQWQKLRELEPKLRSLRNVRPGTLEEIIAQIHFDRLRELTASGDATLLEPVWRDVPKSLARRPDLVVAYARAAMACRRHDLAEKALRHLIDRQWDEQAVLAYGDLELKEPLRPLETAEGWLRDRREDPALLLSCGKLCVRAELYGKARSYLETSLAIRPRLETYQVLAHLMEQLGERDRAIRALGDALNFAVGRRPNLPRVRLTRWLDRRHGTDRRQG